MTKEEFTKMVKPIIESVVKQTVINAVQTIKESMAKQINEQINELINEALYGDDGAVPFVLAEVKKSLVEVKQPVQPAISKPKLTREQMREKILNEARSNASFDDRFGPMETDERSFANKRIQLDNIPETVNKKQVFDPKVANAPGAARAKNALNEQLEAMGEGVNIDGLLGQFGNLWKKGLESQ